MFDFSDVTRFAAKLVDAANTEDLEVEWKSTQARELASEITPPQHTGALAASVHATEDGVEMLDYWRFPEYGTSRMSPRPFVRPAAKSRLEPAAKDLGERAVRELT